MRKNHRALTEAAIRTLPRPTGCRPARHYDSVPGLMLLVTRAGRRHYAYARIFDGIKHYYTLPDVEEISLDEARQEALNISRQLREGRDPRGGLIKDRLLLGKLWDYWVLHAHPRKKHRSRLEDIGLYQRHLAAWAERPANNISRAEVTELHSRIGRQSGPYEANHMLSLLSAIYRFCEDLGVSTNPCRRIRRFPVQARDRFLSAEELARFWAALEKEPPEICLFYAACLLTGQRTGSVAAMRWEELNLELGIWRIGNTKNGRPHAVPLVQSLVGMLQRYRGETAGGAEGLVFRRNPPHRLWKALVARAGIENLRPHDLRRTLASWEAITGANMPTIAQTLGHRTLRATEVYARLSLDSVRSGAEKAVDKMFGGAVPAY